MAPSRTERPGAKPDESGSQPSSTKSNRNKGIRHDGRGHGDGSSSPMARPLDTLLALLIPGLILAHLVVAPYTKVEESFNIQAAHDVLVHGTPTSNIRQRLSASYDHFTFPGAVPRTFVGPVMLAGFAQPIVALVGFQHAQLVVRAILGLFNAGCLLFFARNLRRAYGAGTARWYLLLQASQFHVIFYASRTLPNMFAFGLTTLAFAFLLPDPAAAKLTLYRQRLSITMFVFAAAIFRSEVALLLGATVLHQLVIPTISLERVVFPFAASFFVALATSVPIDSYFWQQPLWPELWGFYFNVVRGGASNWGVSPWHYYFTSALPRLLLNPLAYALLIPYALHHPATRRAASRLVVPPLLFTAIYSFQPHKEARFIFYVVPPLTAAAALGAHRLFLNAGSLGRPAASRSAAKPASRVSVLLVLALLLSIAASFAASTAMLAISALNYPGGEALAYLRAAILSDPAAGPVSAEHPGPVTVHADVLSCMTGVTLFGSTTAATIPGAAAHAAAASAALKSRPRDAEAAAGGGSASDQPIRVGPSRQPERDAPHAAAARLAVDKTEDAALLAAPGFWRRFDYVLAEDPSRVGGGGAGGGGASAEGWDVAAVVQGYAGIEILGPGTPDDGDDEDGNGRNVVGLGRAVARLRRLVRASGLTRGWWVGPRMQDRVYILRRRRHQHQQQGRGHADHGSQESASDRGTRAVEAR
ncbi:hypothetical protein VTJ83DRAFT_2399 [Remersonia thermophila]|uniref:Mannosyltransferase n=1 Tax=Remersonia thermophila TaxID=72144 RepID=A0ABR4DIL2_9PEZI